MSRFQELRQSNICLFFWSLFSAGIYIQDILQDALVASASLSSKEKYHILSNWEVEEKTFGYTMIAIFFISLTIIGVDTWVKLKELTLVKAHCIVFAIIIIPACLVNLGPVVITFTQFLLSTKYASKLYRKESDLVHDRKLLDAAQASIKMKEALSENLPMLVIVCFKMALSTRLSFLEMASSFSSACLFSKAVVTCMMQRLSNESSGFVRMLFWTLVLSSFTYCTLILVTTFAIESERDGLLVPNDPTSGVEESSGLVFVLLSFPTIFFCLLPFTIYDMLPCVLGDSLPIKKYCISRPKPVWYFSVVPHTAGLFYNLSICSYFYHRDPISFSDPISLYFIGDGYDGKVMGFELITQQWDLKIGGGRIYLKGVMVMAMVISSIVYLIVITHTIGMKYRNRHQYRKSYEEALDNEIKCIVKKINNDEENNFLEDYTTLSNFLLQSMSQFSKCTTGKYIGSSMGYVNERMLFKLEFLKNVYLHENSENCKKKLIYIIKFYLYKK